MSQSAKTAMGGMVTALSVIILMPTALDLFVYALPSEDITKGYIICIPPPSVS